MATVSVEDLYPSLLDSCGRGDTSTTQYLLSQGLNVDYIDKKGNFPLLMASSFGRLEVVRFLLEQGASIDLVNPHGESALSKAIERDQTEVARLLRQYGATYDKSKLDLTSTASASVMKRASDEATTKLSEPPLPKHTRLETRSEMGKLYEVSPLKRTRPEFSAAMRLLQPMASQWENIGVLLDVPVSLLDAIRHDHPGSCSACLRDVLRVWLKQVNPPATWESLIEAIEVFDPYTAHKAQEYYDGL